MKFTKKLSLLAASAALAAGLAPTAAQADAVAQAILNLNNFQFALGNGAGANTSGSLFSSLGGFGATPTIDATAELNGTLTGGVSGPLTDTACIGACGSWVQGAVVAGPPTATYAAAFAGQSGNAVTATANAKAEGIVSLKPSGDGSTQSNTNLNGAFSITLAANNTPIEISFDADSFLRGMIDAPGNSTAAYSWTITITPVNTSIPIFSWQPNGQAGGITGGTEFADAFNLTDTVSAFFGIANDVQRSGTGLFEAETNALAAGTYTISIRHTTNADAKLPEPGSLALIGLALCGAAAAGRRRLAKQ